MTGKTLRRHRKSAGMSVREAAERIKVSRDSWTVWERLGPPASREAHIRLAFPEWFAGAAE